MSQTLESIYQLNDEELRDYILSNGYQVDSDQVNNRLIATIFNYNNGTLRPEDAWYVQQPKFNELYMTDIIELGKIANSMNLVLWNGINSLDMVRSILTKYHLVANSEIFRFDDSFKEKAINKRKILIVGGGPVGLMLAIMIKQSNELNKLYEVSIIEKRKKYDREQVILINNESYNLFPDEVKNEIWLKNGHKGCFVLPPSKERGGFCYRNELPLSSAPLFLIEEAMYDYVSHTDVKIYRPTDDEDVCDIDITKNSIRVNDIDIDYDIVVGADGSNSEVRSKILRSYVKELFKPSWGLTIIDHIAPKDLKGIYDSPTETYKEVVNNNKVQNDYRIFRTTYGLLYMALILNDKEAESVKKYINDAGVDVPDWLMVRINQLCYQIQTNKSPELKRENLNIFRVNPTYSIKYSEMKTRPVYLIGDSLVNTNFFTGSGVNVGFRMARNLTELLRTYTHGYIPDEIYKNRQKPEVDNIFAQVTGLQSLEGASLFYYDSNKK